MSDDREKRSSKDRKPARQEEDKETVEWVNVADAVGRMEADALASMLRSENIPVYIDYHSQNSIFPSSAFGGFLGLVKLYVPTACVEDALNLLDDSEDQFLPGLDDAPIEFE